MSTAARIWSSRSSSRSIEVTGASRAGPIAPVASSLFAALVNSASAASVRPRWAVSSAEARRPLLTRDAECARSDMIWTPSSVLVTPIVL